LSLSASDIQSRIEAKFPGKIASAELEVVDPFLVVDKDVIVKLGTFLRDEPELAFDTLHCISGVDYPKEERIDVVYHLTSLKHRHWIVLKVQLPRSGPRMATVESVWPTANWHEREAYDLFGVVFEGHSDFRRILLPDDWAGHPLLKDWEWPEKWHGIDVKPGKQFSKRSAEGEKLGVGPFD
jgi:NADH-quinone oxidoreductase subunit C